MEKKINQRILSLLLLCCSGLSGLYSQTDGLSHVSSTNYLSPDKSRKIETISYFDALGRPIQEKAMGILPGGKSLVQTYQYDELGRQVKSYLPFPVADTTANLVENALGLQNNYYQALYPGKNAFSEVVPENSPFNRILKQAGVGEDINQVIGSSTFVFAGPQVPLWKISGNNLQREGSYPDKSLIKYTVTNEENNSVSVYKDKAGQVMMKEAANTKTLYVYDDYGRLRYVLSPLAVDAMTGNSYSPESEEVKNLCFYYEYNGKHQLTIKQEPGKGYVMYLYDAKDRLRLSQDALQREKGQWAWINYDFLGRTVSTGNGSYSPPAQLPETIETPETGNTGLLTKQYYDNYSFLSPADTSYQFHPTLAFGQDKTNRVRGMATGSKTKVLHDDTTRQWLMEVVYYDKYGRAIQTITGNHLGGVDIAANRYNFAGEVLESMQVHRVPGKDDIAIRYIYEYDPQGRLLKTWQKINAQDSVLVNKLDYNELGQVVQKHIHSENGGQSFLQDVDYTYNIKGQLTRMNDPENLGNDVFALRFYFNEQATGFSHHAYKDGNISAIQYNSKNLNALQTYTYTYDNLNRLTHAVFSQDKYNETIGYDKNGNILSLQRKGKAGAVYTTIDQLSYKYNGNRLLAVNDLDATATQANGFTDNGLFKTGNPTDPLTHEYTHDVNGNMMDDANKMLHILSYNYLNLPDSIDFENDLKIKYLYASGGAKLRQVTYTNGTPTAQLDYSGAFVYENSSLKFIITSEGRLLPTANGFEREYFLTDHLGNTRVVFKKSGDSALIVQENHYYAYGMEIADQSFSSTPVPNSFLYNGKEYDGNTGYYQYGFRQYDAQIGRWHVVDAMSEKYYSTSPYTYVMGNPLSMYDVLGLSAARCYTTSDPKEIEDILRYFSGGGNVNSFLNYASSYSGAKGTTSNNGGDHYFSGTNYSAGGGGIYLGSTERGNSSIRILTTSDIPANFYLSNGFINSAIALANSLILSDARKNGLINDGELMKIFEHYKNELKINLKLNYYLGDPDDNKSMYFDASSSAVYGIKVNLTKWDKTLFYNNYNNIKSDLIHENGHYKDYLRDPVDFIRRYQLKPTYNASIERYAFIDQFNHPSFNYVSRDYHRSLFQYIRDCGINYSSGAFRLSIFHTFYWYNITIGGKSYIFDYLYYNKSFIPRT